MIIMAIETVLWCYLGNHDYYISLIRHGSVIETNKSIPGRYTACQKHLEEYYNDYKQRTEKTIKNG